MVPPYAPGDSFDGWIVLPILATQSAFMLFGSGFEPRSRIQIRASAYLGRLIGDSVKLLASVRWVSTVDLSINVRADADVIWSLLEDPSSWSGWWRGCVAARTLDDRTLSENSELELVLQPKFQKLTFKPFVDLLTENRSLSLTHRSLFVQTTTAWYLVEKPDRTQVTVQSRLQRRAAVPDEHRAAAQHRSAVPEGQPSGPPPRGRTDHGLSPKKPGLRPGSLGPAPPSQDGSRYARPSWVQPSFCTQAITRTRCYLKPRRSSRLKISKVSSPHRGDDDTLDLGTPLEIAVHLRQEDPRAAVHRKSEDTGGDGR